MDSNGLLSAQSAEGAGGEHSIQLKCIRVQEMIHSIIEQIKNSCKFKNSGSTTDNHRGHWHADDSREFDDYCDFCETGTDALLLQRKASMPLHG